MQDVKELVGKLKKSGRSESALHREVFRPWGSYDSIDNGDRFQVKRLSVKPGGVLSLQMHHHRAEHWIVVQGTARITCGDKTFLLTENESTYIPIGARRIASKTPARSRCTLSRFNQGRIWARTTSSASKTIMAAKGPTIELDYLFQGIRFTRPDPH